MSDFEQSFDDESPKFSTARPLNGVIAVQMNKAFASLLREFILSVEGEKESEIWAFTKALKDPGRRRDRSGVPRESSLYS